VVHCDLVGVQFALPEIKKNYFARVILMLAAVASVCEIKTPEKRILLLDQSAERSGGKFSRE
jgi:hypothetical protein